LTRLKLRADAGAIRRSSGDSFTAPDLRAVKVAAPAAPRMDSGQLQGANMDTRKTATVPTQNAMWDPVTTWAGLLDLPRQQSAAATHAACAMLSGMESMRRIQEKTAHQALKQYTEAAGKLEKQCAPLDVLSVQMDLARFDMEAASAYWQQLLATCLQTQAKMAGCGCELVDSDKLLEACAVFEKH
jgi:hypothetical protein